MNDFELENDEIGIEDESDVKVSAESFKQLMLWGTDWTVETILSQLKKGNIDLNPSYQRRNAWNINKKSKLIESLILGLPVPELILAESKEKKGSYIVIDGKQRLLSIRQFCADKNDEDFKRFKLRSLEIIKDLNGIDYNKIISDPLLNNYQSAFENQTIRTIVIKNWPNEDVLYKIFHRLNTGSLKLSPQELRQALHPGPFLTYVDNYSLNNEKSVNLRKVLNLKNPDPRMDDVELLIRYFAFKNFSDKYAGKLKQFLDDTCKSLNEEYKLNGYHIEKQVEEFENGINATFDIFGEDAFRKWDGEKYTNRFNRTVYDIMVYYFSIPEIRNESLKNKDAIKNKFEELCTSDVEFRESFETSTKNVEPTTKRFLSWGQALSEITELLISSPMK